MSSESGTDVDGTAASATEAEADPVTRQDGPADETASDGDASAAVAVTHEPARISRALAVVAVAVGAGLTAPFVLLALPFSLAGLAIVAGSLFVVHSRGWFSVGVALVLLGSLVAGGYGAVPVELMLVAVGATVFGWDVGQFAVGVGAHLGRETATRQLELTHAAFTLAVLALASGFVYFAYRSAGAGRPASAVAVVVVGLVSLAWVYRR